MSQLSLLVGDCRVMLAGIADESVDSCVTDPPYELGFMGKKWDASGVSFDPETWRAVLRVLKPGAHLAAFGGTRTFHRMVCAIEDAGFEIRDDILDLYSTEAALKQFIASLSKEQRRLFGEAFPSSGRCDWLYGTGFPKSLNLGDGRGTALKPGHEPICLARKPLVGTVAANMKRFGTGALNIDGCRIDFASSGDRQQAKPGTTPATTNGNGVTHGAMTRAAYVQPAGRWPANVILSHSTDCHRLPNDSVLECVDDCSVRMLDEQSGERKSGGGQKSNRTSSGWEGGVHRPREGEWPSSTGGASRFFYVAKPSRRERDAGLDHIEPKSGAEATDSAEGAARLNSPRTGAGRTGGKTFYVGVKTEWAKEVLCQAGLMAEQSLPGRDIAAATMQCLDGSEWSTCWCGSPSTDPFHPAIKSIIETKTSSITDQRTFSWLTRPHTNGCMAAAFGEMAYGGSLASCAAYPSPWMQRIGTSAERDGLGTDAAVLATSVASWLASEIVAVGKAGVKSSHPTVKPIELMRHLVRLVTPAGGLVLDPFTGSGTTGIAAAAEGMRFIGVELSEEYAQLATARMKAHAR